MEAVYSFITGDSLIFALIGFLIISYVIVGLLTWSFTKPLKYLGFPIIIVGIICFSLKSILNLAVDSVAGSEGAIIKIFINNSGNLFSKYAVICLIVGVLMIALYYILKFSFKKEKIDNKSEYEKEHDDKVANYEESKQTNEEYSSEDFEEEDDQNL